MTTQEIIISEQDHQENVIYIYGLKCPISGKVRYIGKTNNLKRRYYSHLHPDKGDVNRHKKSWIKKLLKQDKKPELVILEKIYDGQWEEAEIKWIKKGHDEKWGLTNLADGGKNNWFQSADSLGLEFLLADALAGYVDDEKKKKLLFTLSFKATQAISQKAIKNSGDTFFGIGCDIDKDKSIQITHDIINNELDLIIYHNTYKDALKEDGGKLIELQYPKHRYGTGFSNRMNGLKKPVQMELIFG
jgi:predicted GIY-YIG superfamily endonuclease